MAETTIDQLSAVTTAAVTDTFPVTQGGITRRETIAQLITAVKATDAEAVAATSTTVLLIPANIAALKATNAEIASGTSTTGFITPSGLASKTATTSAAGLIEIDTDAEGETGDDTTRAMTAAVNAYINQRGQQLYSASSGTDTYTATLAPVPAALVHGMQINIKFGNASTGASTLNLNSLGAKKIYIESSGAYAQVGSGDIFAGMNATLSYDSALDTASGGWVIKNRKNAAAGAPASVQVFTSSGTWTKPAGITKVMVEVIGGGGGGGFISSNPAGGGGGGGGYSRKLIDVSAIASVAVTIGAGGAAGTTSAGGGSSGGTTSFGEHCSATGGAGAPGVGSGGSGGVGSGGNINSYGDAGGTSGPYGGAGGGTMMGGGGEGSAADGIGHAGKAYGGGGSGGYSAAGAGAAGVVIVTEY